MIDVEYTDENWEEVKMKNLTYEEVMKIIKKINKWVIKTEPQENPIMTIEFN